MNTRQNSDLARERQDYADRQTRMVAADGLALRRSLVAPKTFSLVEVAGGCEWVNGWGHKVLAADGKPFATAEEARKALEGVIQKANQ